jgi:pimeloyl-ACP methyl ester carboxylesterase
LRPFARSGSRHAASQLEVGSVSTETLEIAYEERCLPDAPVVVLLHGFPDDVRAWDQVASAVAAAGYRVIVPYLRGYGPTRFRDPDTPRVGQQAALGQDVIDLLEGLEVERAALAGFDWGCRAACVAAIHSPERVSALLAIGGYDVHDADFRAGLLPPDGERDCWYQWYFHTDRGVRGLTQNRREICRFLWESWSPQWQFDDATFTTTAASFDNPDFVAVVVQGYRHAHGSLLGDPRYEPLEQFLVTGPSINVPSLVLHGAADAIHLPARSLPMMGRFPAGTERRLIEGAGHFLPREAPEAVAEALLELLVADG